MDLYLLYLSRLAVHTGQQQPGGLPHVIAVHREAAPVLGVGDRHPDPLHQGRQYQERPVGGERHRTHQNMSSGQLEEEEINSPHLNSMIGFSSLTLSDLSECICVSQIISLSDVTVATTLRSS